MKYLIMLFFLLALSTICRGQECKKYIVYIFHEDWKKDSRKWSVGDYIWIIPYDSCCTSINKSQLKPLFITKEQRETLNDISLRNLGVGTEAPLKLNDKSDIFGYMLFKNRKLIQIFNEKYLRNSCKRELSVYAVPIIAICKDDCLGFFKKEVLRIDDKCDIWHEFWNSNTINSQPYFVCNFSNFDFVVSYAQSLEE